MDFSFSFGQGQEKINSSDLASFWKLADHDPDAELFVVVDAHGYLDLILDSQYATVSHRFWGEASGHGSIVVSSPFTFRQALAYADSPYADTFTYDSDAGALAISVRGAMQAIIEARRCSAPVMMTTAGLRSVAQVGWQSLTMAAHQVAAFCSKKRSSPLSYATLTYDNGQLALTGTDGCAAAVSQMTSRAGLKPHEAEGFNRCFRPHYAVLLALAERYEANYGGVASLAVRDDWAIIECGAEVWNLKPTELSLTPRPDVVQSIASVEPQGGNRHVTLATDQLQALLQPSTYNLWPSDAPTPVRIWPTKKGCLALSFYIEGVSVKQVLSAQGGEFGSRDQIYAAAEYLYAAAAAVQEGRLTLVYDDRLMTIIPHSQVGDEADTISWYIMLLAPNKNWEGR